MVYLKIKLFYELLEAGNLNTINHSVKDRLRRKTVLNVLDDVDNREQLECLARDHNWFGVGSKIIVTTRDAQLLRKNADEIYKVEGLDFDKALKFFYLNAFKGKSFEASYIRLSKEIVEYIAGNPLALKVLRSFLYFRTLEEWESAFEKLKRIPHTDIQKVLKTSYDGLDDVEKDIFLDIPCFFKGEDKYFLERILDGCNFFSKYRD